MTITEHSDAPRIPLFTAIGTYFGYGLLMVIGHLRDFFHHIFYGKQTTAPKVDTGFLPLSHTQPFSAPLTPHMSRAPHAVLCSGLRAHRE